ncbi:hydantoinase B/oxoprolinase family protein [Microseira wollei]|uniref:5-oxoprolinase (ATP-hydrolyzing) n=1 Tax=Microseira wollei NIES-4236 TaxID=2530354 RepID=A0AAV3XGD6_9CYAN|nr:hydantoinase B/oxoprolinase family protein [Microseira wollei]GET41464.1 hypothetical protein MiSe_62760 [Microseira wollei NIES-4236]
MNNNQWQFFIDRGGTFTDIVAKRPDGQLVIHKLLSENPSRYKDAAVQGIREILGISTNAPIPSEQIDVVKMGTTVATNALLERKGSPTVLLITKGFKDALRIGYQNRPDIFARQIILPEMLYERVIEVEERYSAQGEELIPVNIASFGPALQAAYDGGIRSCAIVLMHGYRYREHEQQVAAVAREIGFPQISVSHQVSPLMKLVSRGDTTVVDAYLSPILRQYVNQIATQLTANRDGVAHSRDDSCGVGILPARIITETGETPIPQNETPIPQNETPIPQNETPIPQNETPIPQNETPIPQNDQNHPANMQRHGDNYQLPITNYQLPKLMFMQSNGGLTDAENFQGKDSILSGPAGGIVGAVQTSLIAGFDKIITFDMGGTSTDVAHYAGEYERTFETEVAGVRLRSPMMAIHTVAAGGGSILYFDGSRYRVGPSSAGANPGPACYRQGGPLTVTDCNVMVGKLQPEFFPKAFGENADLPLDVEVVQQKFNSLARQIGDGRSPAEVAAGFLAIAVDKMANAIKKISLERGYDVSEYTLCCFGGAGGQHACLIADALGMKQVFVHPYAGVLSAYGMGLADERVIRECAVEAKLTAQLLPELQQQLSQLAREAEEELNRKDAKDAKKEEEEKSLHPRSKSVMCKVHLRYEATDSSLIVDFGDVVEMRRRFEEAHRQRYGFVVPEKGLIVEAVSVEVIGKSDIPEEPIIERKINETPAPVAVRMFTANTWHETPLFKREGLQPGDWILGPAIIVEATGTNVIEPGWQAELTRRNHLVLSKVSSEEFSLSNRGRKSLLQTDPVMLEIFNNLFGAIAEQMGITLQNTAASVNIKERLDFSCAIFDGFGQLVANAPHIPVHLGSMSESVKSLIDAQGDNIKPGDVYVLNNPYNGGTHLPDITVITPVFDIGDSPSKILFYVASRGHHADIGGITPGSMPPNSTTVEQEGVLIDNFQLVEAGRFREKEILEILASGNYPARNSAQNIADLQAQIAANERGVQELHKMVEHYGLETVQAYMGFVQDNAEESVRRVIDVLKDGSFTCSLDNRSKIKVTISINKNTRSAKIDFSGTSPQVQSNFNAPAAVCKAAVLYVFRTLVNDDIPLNAGCLKPLEIVIPEGCMLNPRYPAAVVAGNVETSQAITDALYGALGALASAQGTMNNFTFGNERYQYYETICGGSGAGANFDGTDAVHTHMTNSRLTDPEVLEWRFPVVLESFEIRQNSGGKGLHRGGNGVVRRIRFLEKMTAGILSGRRVIPPFGLHGGEAGAVGKNCVQRRDGTIEELGSTATVEINPGDAIAIATPGGGGYGTPR